MKKYDSYKDSGIEWIGDIPSHWDAVKLKYRGESIIGIIYSPDDVITDGKGLLVLRSSNIQDGKLAFDDCVFVDKTVPAKHLTKEGDILLCARNGSAHLVGKAAYIDKENEGVSFGAFMSIVRSNIGKYLFHYFSSQVFKAQTGLFSTSTINQLTSNTLNNMFISLPRDKKEQDAIAEFLDWKIGEIDALISEKTRLLVLYDEEKTAVINQAVTKGLDPNAPIQDSEIDWLGEIPSHWEVKKMKYFFTLITEKVQDGLPKIGLENIESKSGVFVNTDSNFEGHGVGFAKNDLLFGKLRPYLAKVWLATFEGEAVGDFYVFRPRESVFGPFAKYKILDTSFIDIVNSSTYGSKMPRANWEFIGHLKIAIPSYTEQQSIVRFIDYECQQIEAKKEKAAQLLDLLKEYRLALISAVVTGKVKVI